MGFTEYVINRPNFLASEVGLRTVTYTFNSSFSGAVTENGRKTIKAGTIYPTNDASAKGIVFADIDVTDGNAVGSLMVGGRYYSNKLPAAVSSTAKTAFINQGLYGENEPTMTLPSDGTL